MRYAGPASLAVKRGIRTTRRGPLLAREEGASACPGRLQAAYILPVSFLTMTCFFISWMA